MIPLQTEMLPWLLENPEVGWVAVILYLMWEIRGPRGKIAELTKLLENVTVVVRGLARAQNNDEDVDIQSIDEYLAENGQEPSDFIDRDKNDKSDDIVRGGD